MPVHNSTSLTSQLTDTTDKRFCTDAQKTVIGNTSGANTGDQTLPVKASGAEIDTGTDDAKFATAKAIADSKVMKSPASAVDNHAALFDGTSGKLVKDAGYKPVLVMSGLYANADQLLAVTTTNEQYFATYFTLPANWFNTGKILRVTIGFVSVSTASPNLTVRLKAGTTTLMGNTASAPSSGTFYAGFQWLLQGTGAPGGSVSVDIENVHHYVSSAWASRWGAGGLISLPTNATIDLKISAQWSAATAGNTMNLRQYLVEDVSP